MLTVKERETPPCPNADDMEALVPLTILISQCREKVRLSLLLGLDGRPEIYGLI